MRREMRRVVVLAGRGRARAASGRRGGRRGPRKTRRRPRGTSRTPRTPRGARDVREGARASFHGVRERARRALSRGNSRYRPTVRRSPVASAGSSRVCSRSTPASAAAAARATPSGSSSWDIARARLDGLEGARARVPQRLDANGADVLTAVLSRLKLLEFEPLNLLLRERRRRSGTSPCVTMRSHCSRGPPPPRRHAERGGDASIVHHPAGRVHRASRVQRTNRRILVERSPPRGRRRESCRTWTRRARGRIGMSSRACTAASGGGGAAAAARVGVRARRRLRRLSRRRFLLRKPRRFPLEPARFRVRLGGVERLLGRLLRRLLRRFLRRLLRRAFRSSSSCGGAGTDRGADASPTPSPSRYLHRAPEILELGQVLVAHARPARTSTSPSPPPVSPPRGRSRGELRQRLEPAPRESDSFRLRVRIQRRRQRLRRHRGDGSRATRDARTGNPNRHRTRPSSPAEHAQVTRKTRGPS